MKIFYFLFFIFISLFISAKAQDKVLSSSQKELEQVSQNAKEATLNRMNERAELLKAIELIQKEISEQESIKKQLIKEERDLKLSAQDSLTGKNRLASELQETLQKFELAKTEHNLNRPVSVLGAAGLIKEAQADIDMFAFFKMLTTEESSTNKCVKVKGNIINENQQKVLSDLFILGNLQGYSIAETSNLLALSGSTFISVKDASLHSKEAEELNQIQPMNVPIDITGGAALTSPAISKPVWFRLQDGGMVVWPILLVGAVALLIIVFKFAFLTQVGGSSLLLEANIQKAKAESNWLTLEEYCRDKKQMAYLLVSQAMTHKKKNEKLTDELLEEKLFLLITRLERFMPTLNVLGVIAPLLGLLGTVTGMIATFDVISVHGSGNPGLLSKGISEALITTELGLIVAIPVILFHSLLSSKIDRQIQDLESIGNLLSESSNNKSENEAKA